MEGGKSLRIPSRGTSNGYRPRPPLMSNVGRPTSISSNWRPFKDWPTSSFKVKRSAAPANSDRQVSVAADIGQQNPNYSTQSVPAAQPALVYASRWPRAASHQPADAEQALRSASRPRQHSRAWVEACRTSTPAPGGARQGPSGCVASSQPASSSVNKRERVRKRWPVGPSSENMPPRPGTTSMISWVCCQYSNCGPLM